MDISGVSKGTIYVVISSLGFSIIPILATLGFSANMAAGTMIFYRFFIAGCLFFIYCIVRKERLKFQQRRNYLYLVMAGIIYTFQCILFFSAFQYISASVGEVIFYIYPVFVAILSAVFLKEKITKVKMIGNTL
ncbi:MAG: DMT family transporter [Anaerovorax sp.]